MMNPTFWRSPQQGPQGQFTLGDMMMPRSDTEAITASFPVEYRPYVSELISEGWDVNDPDFEAMIESRIALDRGMELPLFGDPDSDALSTQRPLDSYKMQPRSMDGFNIKGRQQ